MKMRRTFKNRDFWLIVFILIYGFYSGLFRDLFSLKKDDSALTTARIEIDYGQFRRAFEGDVLADMTVLDALLAASRGGGFEVRYALLNDKTEIMKINSHSEDGLGGQWRFYLNGTEIDVGKIHKIEIKPGDKIFAEFK